MDHDVVECVKMHNDKHVIIMKKLIRKFIARLHLNNRIVCEESIGLGLVDFHDYSDSIDGEPWHFGPIECKRCGKKFII